MPFSRKHTYSPSERLPVAWIAGLTNDSFQALTTGSIPGFVDVVLNFGSTELKEDSLILQWKNAGLEMTMFGDDTWIKLFPGKFLREDGTTSFFVADYTEVSEL